MGTFKGKKVKEICVICEICVTFKRKNLWESVKSVGLLKGCFSDNWLITCRFLSFFLVVSRKMSNFDGRYKLNKGDEIMMLGINAPKPLIKGEFAKAVRKAVHDSMVAKENWKEPAAKGPWKVKFIVR